MQDTRTPSREHPLTRTNPVSEPLGVRNRTSLPPIFRRTFELENSWKLEATVEKADDRFFVSLSSTAPGPLMLHWGVARHSPGEWLLPSESEFPASTSLWRNQAARTPFSSKEGFRDITLEFNGSVVPLGLQFVLLVQGPTERWLKYQGNNFYVPVGARERHGQSSAAGQYSDLADRIIRAETTHNSWTLMHRFNLCHDMLDEVRGDMDGLELLYVWLRFSSIRQLTWQRNYNTKPRELAHAQERLTHKVAEVYRSEANVRPMTRLILSTVGPGGEGQRIRDEILNIMHRHHVKEVSGHFLEEWHQKLHNNTTPDDVVICEAYLEFLRSNGDLNRFYQTLEAGGVNRQRLQSFERPIRSDPQFVPHLKDGLIGDFQNFLKILKASHSGIDLETAFNGARNQLEGGWQDRIRYIRDHRNDPGIPPAQFIGQITVARRWLASILERSASRELIYLDLALEQLVRTVIERNLHLSLGGEQVVELVSSVLENLRLSVRDLSLAACLRHWQRLISLPRFGEQWSLHAKSVVDRAARSLSAWLDRLYDELQPKAEVLGYGFKAEEWTIKLISEEVVRGNSVAFGLASLFRHLEPLLRRAAHLGDWQIVSRGRAVGMVQVVATLHSIQSTRFERPAIVIADKVLGDEEIPEGVVGVIAPDVTDIVSHVAVRARNADILFATCHSQEMLTRLKALNGQVIQLEVNTAGQVEVAENVVAQDLPEKPPARRVFEFRPPQFTEFAVRPHQFTNQLVGAKALNLARLQHKLPDWIHTPSSVAIPFCVFEHVLNSAINERVSARYRELLPQAESGDSELLKILRQTVLDLEAPVELRQAVDKAIQEVSHPSPSDWSKVWHGIKQVWASKWNERAAMSRKRFNIPSSSLYMAVLIQSVVPADYAFVLHSVNPITGDKNEVYGEIVLGLGETLVGNYPGRALSFVWNKTAKTARLLSYPGKDIGLYGGGLIFRSDSNAEDLSGYAGAGLYDSVLLDPPQQVLLDYAQQPLVWDERYRDELINKLGEIAVEIERSIGSPQDIEGAVTQGSFYVVQTRPQVGLGT